jgi:hypothetical protein
VEYCQVSRAGDLEVNANPPVNAKLRFLLEVDRLLQDTMRNEPETQAGNGS